jgi:hypothetical protein
MATGLLAASQAGPSLCLVMAVGVAAAVSVL